MLRGEGRGRRGMSTAPDKEERAPSCGPKHFAAVASGC